jgi:hypothetical protein
LRNKRLNPWAAVLILLGVVIPTAAFFASIWQSHPDPSAVKIEDLSGLKILVLKGHFVFKSPETGEILPAEQMNERQFKNEAEMTKFWEENVFEEGRVEIRVIYIIAVGVLLLAAGMVLSLKKR